MKMFIRFSYHFFIIVGRLQAVLLALIALVVISAVVISPIENLPFGETLYFTSDTAILSLRHLWQDCSPYCSDLSVSYLLGSWLPGQSVL